MLQRFSCISFLCNLDGQYIFFLTLPEAYLVRCTMEFINCGVQRWKFSQKHYILHGTKYSRMDQVKFFKGCLPQVLLGPFLNTLSHIFDSVINTPSLIATLQTWLPYLNCFWQCRSSCISADWLRPIIA